MEEASAEDHPAVVSVVNRAYRGVGYPHGWNTEAGLMSGDRIRLEQLRDDLSANLNAKLMVLREGSHIHASVWIQPETDAQWYFGMLAIDPTLQAMGVGKSMLQAIEQFVTDRGGRRIRITVINVRESLIGWYERHGYTRTGEVEPFPYGDDRFGTPLRDDLNFVVLIKNPA